MVHLLLDSDHSFVHLWLRRCRMPYLQLPSTSRKPTRRQGRDKWWRRRTSPTTIRTSSRWTSRTGTYAIWLIGTILSSFEEYAIDTGVAYARAVTVRCCDSAFLVFVCLKRRYSLVLRRIRIPYEGGDGWVSFDKEHFA